MLLELNHNIQQAQQSIHNNTWLAGARFLHGVVITTRKHINNVDSKPFMEWAHLQNDLSKLTVGWCSEPFLLLVNISELVNGWVTYCTSDVENRHTCLRDAGERR